MTTHPLYQTLLQRRSIRRYKPQPLNPADLNRVTSAMETCQPFLPDIKVHIQNHKIAAGLDLVKLLGAYGRLVSPPHALLPTSPDEPFSLVEQG